MEDLVDRTPIICRRLQAENCPESGKSSPPGFFVNVVLVPGSALRLYSVMTLRQLLAHQRTKNAALFEKPSGNAFSTALMKVGHRLDIGISQYGLLQKTIGASCRQWTGTVLIRTKHE